MEKTEIENITASLHKYILHAAYGQAVLEAHGLESSLAILLATKLSDKHHDFNHQFNKIKKHTLGMLIGRVLQEFDIPEYWQEELDNALWFRNRLIHQITEDASIAILRDGDVTKLIEELSDIYGYFKEAKEYIDELVYAWFSKKGVRKDMVLSVVKELIENARKKEPTTSQPTGELDRV